MSTSMRMPTAPSMATPPIITASTITTTALPTVPCAVLTICITVTDPLVPMPQA